ncbi:MAG TPA: M14 family metallocarboxypeptidase [Burkholderiales bacterium]|nr:M14 family metallocarboxypeptidase [Burkholderiales bacterium]
MTTTIMHCLLPRPPSILLALAVLAASPLHAQFDTERAYRQSEAVRLRYPDPSMRFDTPGFAPGRTDFTSQQEMMQFISALQPRARNMEVRVAGHSQEGRAIPVLVFRGPNAAAAPVVLLVGLQHGNEPAGGEAMLVMAQELAAGSLTGLLDRITVVIMPRANPDGAHYFTRSPYGNTDINRDHVKVDLPETAALHRVVNEFQPHVFADAHEFSVATRWIEKFGLLQSYDFTLLYATNPNVPRPLTELANGLFLRDLRREMEKARYTWFWYYTTSYDLKDKRVAMGGTTPDIGRNFAGLQNAISFLVETRGVGIGRDSYARRVHTHLVAMTSLLTTTAENAERVLKAVRELRADIVRRGQAPSASDTIAVTLKQTVKPQKLTMMDPANGQLRDIEVEWVDSLAAEPELARNRPYAYLMPPQFHEVARRLALSGIAVQRLRQPVTLEVESYEVTERRASATYVEGRITSRVTTEVSAKTRTFPVGTYVYLMGQPNANVIAVALEPESPSSFVSFGYVPVDRRGAPATIAAPSEVPVYRLLKPAALEFQEVEPRPK